jgi:tryptophan synthase alpha chain
MLDRIAATFAATKAADRAALIAFIMAGDPTAATTAALLDALPAAGADIIELGMPFSDPMADGPSIQAAALRALRAGATMQRTLALVQGFRQKNHTTPLILMGYLNPLLAYGATQFLADAAAAGVDGLIIVDLPPEEDHSLRLAANQHGMSMIRLATPTTDAARLPAVLAGAGGFLYYVSIAGITGTKSAGVAEVQAALNRFRQSTSLPLAVGFGIRTPAQLQPLAAFADGVIVGSVLTDCIAARLDEQAQPKPGLVAAVAECVRGLAAATRRA